MDSTMLGSCGALFIVGLLLLWAAPVIVGTIIGAKKGKGGIGFVLSCFLSWIGVIIIALLSDDVKRDQQHQEMIAAVSGGKEVVKIKCLKCGALVTEGVKFCPECGAAM